MEYALGLDGVVNKYSKYIIFPQFHNIFSSKTHLGLFTSICIAIQVSGQGRSPQLLLGLVFVGNFISLIFVFLFIGFNSRGYEPHYSFCQNQCPLLTVHGVLWTNSHSCCAFQLSPAPYLLDLLEKEPLYITVLAIDLHLSSLSLLQTTLSPFSLYVTINY